MDLNYLIQNAVEKNEIAKLLRGEKEYEITISEFTLDVFPTEIDLILVNCIYKKIDNYINIDQLFIKALRELIESSATDLYTAILYFHTCIFQEEIGNATFLINREFFSNAIRKAVQKNEKELKNYIVFCNGNKKINPYQNISNFNEYYKKKYNFSII